MNGCIHVFPREKEWAVRREGAKRNLSRHGTEEDALDAARRLARQERLEIIVHARSGKIAHRERTFLRGSEL